MKYINEILYSPPVVFLIMTAVVGVLSAWLSKYAVKAKTGEGALDSYACGEKGYKSYVNPDYSRFFAFAFIFTVLHVLTMVVATAPANITALPVCYMLAGIYAIIAVMR